MSTPPSHVSDARAVLHWHELPWTGDLSVVLPVLRERSYPWLLDSASTGDRLGCFSFAGADPYLVATVHGPVTELECRRAVRPGLGLGSRALHGDPFGHLAPLLSRFELQGDDAPPGVPFIGGAVGYFGYELAAQLEPVVEFEAGDDLGFPDLTLLFVDSVLALDHARGRVYAIGVGYDHDPRAAAASARRAADSGLALLHAAPQPQRAGGSVKRTPEREAVRRNRVLSTPVPEDAGQTLSRADYITRVQHVKDEIAKGNVYEANLTQRMSLRFDGDALDLYLALRRASPAPFGCFIELPSGSILGSSPERFLRMTASGDVESRPIKGTRPRGASAAEDEALARELAESPKDRAENLMIVDLVRNDLGRVCEAGSVAVPELMAIEGYVSVFQLVSTVTGRLRGDQSALDLVRACFPPGSMTGAPKLAAMRLLDRLEPVPRGVYSGVVGYLDLRGGLDLAVVIRSLLLKKGYAYLHVGGAVVTDSDPADEYAESLVKARALFAALAEAGA